MTATEAKWIATTKIANAAVTQQMIERNAVPTEADRIAAAVALVQISIVSDYMAARHRILREQIWK